VDPDQVQAGSRIRTVIERRLMKMYNKIKKDGWKDSAIRLMNDPNDSTSYLCIDGMHRVEALKKLKRDDKKFENFKLNATVYPHLNEYYQCILADSNFICFIF
jgi:hypothetical protein